MILEVLHWWIFQSSSSYPFEVVISKPHSHTLAREKLNGKDVKSNNILRKISSSDFKPLFSGKIYGNMLWIKIIKHIQVIAS